jgi:hypothetical protein
MHSWRVAGAALALAFVASAQPPVRRTGDGQWAREIKGTIPAVDVERLKVLSPGRVVVRPSVGAKREITYTWNHRVQARSEAEARARLDAI